MSDKTSDTPIVGENLRPKLEVSAHRSNQRDEKVQMALWIAGCLAAQSVIPIDLDKPDTFDDLEAAVRVIYASLTHSPEDGDMFSLPFDW